MGVETPSTNFEYMDDKLHKFTKELSRAPGIWSAKPDWREVGNSISEIVDDYLECYESLEKGDTKGIPSKEILLARQKILIEYAMMLERKLADTEIKVTSLSIQVEGMRGF